ncbi:MAG: hypothetical protein KME43_16320 [Myxacorys chilensis ATA2-1-KO14]|jgi:cobalamin-dependent methionine synthase I|nr:hypothetical protein [Myxacorys chilensis ATA2-1-KO14]
MPQSSVQVPIAGHIFVETLAPTPQIYTHIITLINRRTSDEKCLTVETLSDRFVDVMREITHQKVTQRLQGYEVYEVLPDYLPF